MQPLSRWVLRTDMGREVLHGPPRLHIDKSNGKCILIPNGVIWITQRSRVWDSDTCSFYLDWEDRLVSCGAIFAKSDLLDQVEGGWLYELNERTIPIFLSLPYTKDCDREVVAELWSWASTVREMTRWAALARGFALKIEGFEHHKLPAVPTYFERERPQIDMFPSFDYEEIPFEEWTEEQGLTVLETGEMPTRMVCQSISTAHYNVKELVLGWTTFPLMEIYQPYSPFHLYSQQLTGVAAILLCRRIPLWFEPRVGKTYTALTAAKYALRHGLCRRIIIICPSINMYDPWFNDLTSYQLSFCMMEGMKQDDQDNLSLDFEAYVINYERVGSRLTSEDFEGAFVILDETSAIKNPEAKRTKAIHSLIDSAAYVVPLNGTPIEQGGGDLWSQMRLVDPWGVFWSPSFKSYCKRWLVRLANGRLGLRGKETKEAFQNLLSDSSLRCTQGEADQFTGQSKRHRYIKIKPTQEQIERTKNAIAGVTQAFDDPEQSKQMSTHILACYAHLIDITSGQWKTQDAFGLPFIKSFLETDAKALWIRCFLSSTNEPLIIYCERSWQEHAYKTLCDELEVPWSSTSPKGKWVKRPRLTERIRPSSARHLLSILPADAPYTQMLVYNLAVYEDLGELIPVPPALRYLKEYFTQVARDEVGYYDDLEFTTYSRLERSGQIARFNYGESRVMILKTSQGRGIKLNRHDMREQQDDLIEAGQLSRNEAAAEGSIRPSIIFATPSWSLGSHQQAMERAMAIDPKTGKAIVTPIFYSVIAGSIDEQIVGALKEKKSFQEEALKDCSRANFESFTTKLVESMEAAQKGDGYFDAEEIGHRIKCGVPPYAKLTSKSLHKFIAQKYEITQRDAPNYGVTRLTDSYCYLLGLCRD